MNEEKKELQEEIKYLRQKRNSYYKLLRITNSYEKGIIRRQIKELSNFIHSKKSEIKRIKTENILEVIYNRIEKKLARERMFI